MNKVIIRGVLLPIVSLCMFGFLGTVLAQSTSLNDGDGDSSTNTCITFQTPFFRYLSTDKKTNGEVSILQDFLISKNFLLGSPTGYYGRLTVAGVKSYQRSVGVYPTGNVGVLTKGIIEKTTCSESGDVSINPTNTYNPKTNPIACTMEYRTCPDGSAMPRDSDCTWRSDKCPATSSVIDTKPNAQASVSATPTVEPLGTPTLTLTYNSAGKEANLVGKISVKVTAGSEGIVVDTNSFRGMAALFNTSGNSYQTSGATYTYGGASSSAGTKLVPYTSATFNVTATIKAGQLFAGSYYIKPSGFVYMNSEGTYVGTNEIKSSPSSNIVTVIGEVSPYITGVSSDSTSIKISGVRFHATANTVTIGGVSKTLPSTNGGTVIYATMKDFGITTAGTYVVQVSTGAGASNSFAFATGAVVNSPPTVEPLGTPTLTLTYNSAGKEANLVGKISVKVTAGSEGIVVDTNSFRGMATLYSYKGGPVYTSGATYTYAGAASSSGTKLVPYTSATFNVTATVKAGQLFANSYFIMPVSFAYMNSAGSYEYTTALKSTPSSNIVTVIGEVSPYITGVSSDSTSIKISGVRFHATANTVTIGGVSKTLPSTNGGTVIYATMKDFGITTAGTYVVQVSTGAGASNGASFTVSSVTSSSPTVTLTANPNVITAGQSSTLTLSSTGVSGGCGGTNVSDGKTNGTSVVSPTQTTTYTVTCFELPYNGGRAVSSNVTVTVVSSVPSLTGVSVSTLTDGNRVLKVNGENLYNPNSLFVNNGCGGSVMSNKGGTVSELVFPIENYFKSGCIQVGPPFSVYLLSGDNQQKTNTITGITMTVPVLSFPGCSIATGSAFCTVKTSYIKPEPGLTYDLYNATTYITTPNAYNAGNGYVYNPSTKGTAADLTYGTNNLELRVGGTSQTQAKVAAKAGCLSGIPWNGEKCSTGPIVMNVQESQVLGASTMCVNLSSNLHRGAESSSVTKLQKFLSSKGFLTAEPTGFYGDMTVEAVKLYQSSVGITSTGMVYDLTRQAIKMETCN